MSNYIGRFCQYCGKPISEGDTVAVCSECHIPQHLSCRQSNKGCTTPGCKGTIESVVEVTAPQPMPETAQPTEPLQTFSANEPKAPAPKKKKNIGLIAVIAIIIVLLVIGAVTAAVVFFGIPFLNYKNAASALENGEFDAAYEGFTDLGDFRDSEEMATKALYEKAKKLLEDKEYDEAKKLFVSLDDYSDSKDLAKEAVYRKADDLLDDKEYEKAYELFSSLKKYEDSKKKRDECIYEWVDYVLEQSGMEPVEKFVNTVTLEEEHYSTVYSKICAHIDNNTSFDYWNDSVSGVYKSVVVLKILEMLPSYYEETTDLKKLFEDMSNGKFYDASTYIRENRSFIEDMWDIEFIQDFVASDAAIAVFLEGYWESSDGEYYIEFYEAENGSTTSSFDLPEVEKPEGTKYYDITNMVYCWADDEKNLADVFKFTIEDPDTIKVYCYENNRTYIMYRY